MKKNEGRKKDARGGQIEKETSRVRKRGGRRKREIMVEKENTDDCGNGLEKEKGY